MTTVGVSEGTLPSRYEIEVRSRFDGRWVRGFEIATGDRDRYFVRRRSDGTVLPVPFSPQDVRPLTPPPTP